MRVFLSISNSCRSFAWSSVHPSPELLALLAHASTSYLVASTAPEAESALHAGWILGSPRSETHCCWQVPVRLCSGPRGAAAGPPPGAESPPRQHRPSSDGVFLTSVLTPRGAGKALPAWENQSTASLSRSYGYASFGTGTDPNRASLDVRELGRLCKLPLTDSQRTLCRQQSSLSRSSVFTCFF